MLLRAVEKQTHLGLLFTRESLVHQMIEIARQRACFVQCALPKAEQLVNDNWIPLAVWLFRAKFTLALAPFEIII